MKTKTPFTEIDSLEKELAGIAPLVRQGFLKAGGPSAKIEESIRAEAARLAGGKRNRLAWPLYRTLAAVAAFALLLGGSIQLHISRQDSLNPPSTPRPSASETVLSAKSAENGPGLANLLLEIQGLSEDGFFRPEEDESLWL